MGLLEKALQDSIESRKEDNKLLTDNFEVNLIEAMNSQDVQEMAYVAKEMGFDINKKTKKPIMYHYGEDSPVVICPEPLTFLHDFDDVSDDKDAANKRFREYVEKFEQLDISQKPTLDGINTMWLNKTINGINLRPGHINADRGKFTGIQLNDEAVHGLIVGRTGSGKSVFINQLIMSLVTEYAPWELDVYLADFKKVELGRYMNISEAYSGDNRYTPHVKACAATSEIRYVVSMLRYITDCMNARNELFTRLGVTKIKDFRNTYGVVLPRVILIIDEFQQLFKEATSKEEDEIQFLLNSITKLGRSTGFHLIFASQEMSGTLVGDTLSNFKVRMALPCNKDISASILGNTQASELDVGYVYINKESGEESQNIKFNVPQIKTDEVEGDNGIREESPFSKYLGKIKENASKFNIEYKKETQKFYREELQEREKQYLDDLDRIADTKNKIIKTMPDTFDALILGKTVLYSPKKNDKVAMYINGGFRKSMVVASPDKDDLARILKLLAENFGRSKVRYHININLDGVVSSKFDLNKCLNIKHQSKVRELTDDEKASLHIARMLALRSNADKQLKDRNNNSIIEEFKSLLDSIIEMMSPFSDMDGKYSSYEEYILDLKEINEEISQTEKDIERSQEELKKSIDNPLARYIEILDSTLRIIPGSNEPILFSYLDEYKSMIDDIRTSINTIGVLEKYLEYITSIIDGFDSDKADVELLRLKVLRVALQHYNARLTNTEEPNFVAKDKFNSCYDSMVNIINSFEKHANNLAYLRNKVDELEEKLIQLKITRDNILANPSEEYKVVDKAQKILKSFLISCCISDIDDVFNIDDINSRLVINFDTQKGLTVDLSGNKTDTDEVFCDELNIIAETFKMVANGADSPEFLKTVIWFNGFDRLGDNFKYKLDSNLEKLTYYNILPIISTSSEVSDYLVKRAFDYYFITGNNEKIYDMVNARYTKQAIGSIVVNAGVVSLGIETPFKMYKSDLNKPNDGGFLDSLLNEV